MSNDESPVYIASLLIQRYCTRRGLTYSTALVDDFCATVASNPSFFGNKPITQQIDEWRRLPSSLITRQLEQLQTIKHLAKECQRHNFEYTFDILTSYTIWKKHNAGGVKQFFEACF